MFFEKSLVGEVIERRVEFAPTEIPVIKVALAGMLRETLKTRGHNHALLLHPKDIELLVESLELLVDHYGAPYQEKP